MDPSQPPTTAPAPVPEVPKQAVSLTLSSGGVFAAAVATQLIGFAGSFFLYHHIGVSIQGQILLGTVQLFLLIGTSINGLGDLRLGTAYTFFLARGKPPTDNTTVYLVVRMILVGLCGLVIFALAPSTGITSGNLEWTALGIFVALPILWSFSTVYNQMYIGLGNSVRAQYPALLEATARLPVLIWVAYYDHTILGLTIAYVVGAATSTVYAAPVVIRYLRGFQWTEWTRMFRFAWPLMGSLMLNYLVTNMIPLLVDEWLHARDLSIFLAANGFRILVLALPTAVATPFFPYIAGLHRQEKYQAIREGAWQALRYTSILLVPGVVALVVYRTNFLNIFTTRLYAVPGALPLAILVVAAIPLALSQIMQSTLNSIGRQRLELYLTSAQVAVLIASVILLVSPWGVLPASDRLVGASVAVLLSSVAAIALNTYFLETLIRVRIQPWSILRITLSAAIAFGAISRLNRYLPVSSWYQLASVVVLCFVVYFLVLALTGELSKQDVQRIGGSMALPPRWRDGIARLCWRKSLPGLPPVDLSTAPGLRPLRQTELPETFTGTTETPDIGSPLPEEGTEPKLQNGPPPE
ncbi:MAG: polysaccharide biosynthesis C-terminal domain-containing protein [Thermoplasmata archaeon]